MEPAFIESIIINKEVGEYLEQRWLELKKIINDDPQAGLNLYNRRNETCGRKWTYMHYVCLFGTEEEFVKVVQPLSKTKKLMIFKQQSLSDTTALMRLIANNPIRKSSAIVKSLQLLFNELSHDEKLELLLMEECRGWNALALAAFYNCVSAIESLLTTIKFDPQQQLKLMKFSWRYESDTISLGGESGYGSDEEAGVKNPVSAAELAHMKGRKESAELLERLKVDAMIRVTVETKCTGLKMKSLHEIVSHESLTPIQLEKLSSHFNRYILPRNKAMSRKHAFVCYTTGDREGAVVEAENLIDGLEMLDHEIMALPWSSARSFAEDFKNNLERIKSTCCFLTVCVMAHGSPGAVRGDDGSVMPVNDILYHVTHSLPHHIPVVVVIQSCQKSSLGDAYDAERGSADSNTRAHRCIQLKRPHTLLFMSTINGRTSLRGAYTGELAHQFRQADGKTSVTVMHYKAVQRMNGGYEWQVPESRCTLIRGSLVFPQPTCISEKRGVYAYES